MNGILRDLCDVMCIACSANLDASAGSPMQEVINVRPITPLLLATFLGTRQQQAALDLHQRCRRHQEITRAFHIE